MLCSEGKTRNLHEGSLKSSLEHNNDARERDSISPKRKESEEILDATKQIEVGSLVALQRHVQRRETVSVSHAVTSLEGGEFKILPGISFFFS